MSKEYLLDGSKIASLETFYGEMDRALGKPVGYTPNLDWLDDILSGGVEGIPDDGVVVRWMHSEESRQHLGPKLFGKLEELMEANSNVSLVLQ